MQNATVTCISWVRAMDARMDIAMQRQLVRSGASHGVLPMLPSLLAVYASEL